MLVAGHKARQGGLHLECAQAGPESVVIVGRRHSEDGQHRGADELLQRPTEMDDRVAENGQRTIDARSDFFRVQLVHQTGVAHEIGEQGGHDPPIANLQTVRQRVETAAALMAIASAGNRRSRAVGTGHRDLFGTSEWYAPLKAREAAVTRRSGPAARVRPGR